MNLWCCESISLNYRLDKEINQTLKKFYHASSDAPDFYYVNSWKDGRVFSDFVDEFIKYTGMTAEKDLISEVLYIEENAVVAMVQDQSQLMTDSDFVELLNEYKPGIKNSLPNNSIQDEDEEEDETYTPDSFTAKTYEEDEEAEEDTDFETDTDDYEDETENGYPATSPEKPAGSHLSVTKNRENSHPAQPATSPKRPSSPYKTNTRINKESKPVVRREGYTYNPNRKK
ncbi:MAG: hypothetical protein LUH15_19795 [Tannerellaceae bacterium]|nr:hypothetical protein [Tannerellaceae bacterium]